MGLSLSIGRVWGLRLTSLKNAAASSVFSENGFLDSSLRRQVYGNRWSSTAALVGPRADGERVARSETLLKHLDAWERDRRERGVAADFAATVRPPRRCRQWA